MEIEGLPEVNPPSGRVPRQRLLASPILKQRWRRNIEEIGKMGSGVEGFRTGGKYMRKGQPGGPPGAQAPPRCGPTAGRATRAPGALVGPLLPPLGDSESFRHADFLSDFPGIYWAL